MEEAGAEEEEDIEADACSGKRGGGMKSAMVGLLERGSNGADGLPLCER